MDDPLNLVYDKEDEIPEAHRELYTKVDEDKDDSKWELTGITGLKTQADIDKLNESIRKERAETKKFKDKLAVWGEFDHEQVVKDLEELDEARIRLEAGDGKVDDEKIEKIVDARVVAQVAPVKRDLEKVEEERDGLLGKVGDFEAKDTVRTVTDSVRKAAVGLKIIDTAMDDVLMLGERVFEVTDDGAVLTRDSVGCTPGIAPDVWIAEMQEKRPHWWPTATGGGGKGSGAGGGFTDNPFTHQHWNMTKQGEAMRGDKDKADRMAKAAGTTIGGPRPAAPKT